MAGVEAQEVAGLEDGEAGELAGKRALAKCLSRRFASLYRRMEAGEATPRRNGKMHLVDGLIRLLSTVGNDEEQDDEEFDEGKRALADSLINRFSALKARYEHTHPQPTAAIRGIIELLEGLILLLSTLEREE